MPEFVRIGDLAEQIRGVTFSKAEGQSAPGEGLVPVLTASNITERGLVLGSVLHVPARKISDRQYLRRHDLLITASSGSLNVVGRAAMVKQDMIAGFGAFCKVLRPTNRVEPSYFAHYFRTPQYRTRVSQLAAGANINNLRNEDLDNLEIPLPPLPEQRRIAAILDQADELRAKRRRALAFLDDLAESVFIDMFGDVAANGRGWESSLVLGEVAEVVSGITKGRRTTRVAREVPYLTVANVQNKALRLDIVKFIGATEAEIARYALIEDDLLLTEGGDPDKLGRGALWRGELAECIHQNHVFRVRLRDRERMDPLFLSWLVGSARGKSYFLRAAKQTTGIASINSTQLRAFPLLSPPVELQREFAVHLGRLRGLRQRTAAHLAKLDELFASLQYRAFQGEL